MKVNTLIKICVIGAVAGIISLFFISQMILPLEVSPGEISQDLVGRKVKVSGTVGDTRVHPSGHIFFEIGDESGSIDVVIWEEKAEQMALTGIDIGKIRDGAYLEATGYVEYYKGDPQIVL